MNDIMKVIADFKKSQSLLLTSNAYIGKLQGLKFSELKKDFKDISNLYYILQTENYSLSNELSHSKTGFNLWNLNLTH